MKELFFYRAVNLLTSLFPRRTCYALARRVSALAYRHQHADRRAVRENLRVVLTARGEDASPGRLDELVRATFLNFGKYVVDFFQMGRLSAQALNALVDIENEAYVEQCLRLGKGVLALTAHVGSWEVGASVLVARGCRVNAVIMPQPSPGLSVLFGAQRERRGINALPLGNASTAALHCLRRGEIVAILGDWDFSDRVRPVRFFNQPAHLPRGPAVLAARAGVPLLPGFVLRRPDDRFRLRFYPPIMPNGSVSTDELQRRICAIMEEVIGENPDQWYAFRPLWGLPKGSYEADRP